MSEYAHPEVIVETSWVADHLHDPGIRLVEVDVDTAAYEEGHAPQAVAWNWTTDTQDQLRRDIPDKSQFEALLSRSGITPETTVVLYGDNNNWFAAYAFWLLKIYRHEDARIMNGGRKRWIEENRPLTKEVPAIEPSTYRVADPDLKLRARWQEVDEHLKLPGAVLVDVRSPAEFSGEVLAPPGLPETAQRAGHIPGAVNIPWSQAVAEDGTFRPHAEIAALYRDKGVAAERDVVVYCRIGERSSHTWFVLKHLLGYENVRNYDGSWTEWGSMVAMPIEKGA